MSDTLENHKSKKNIEIFFESLSKTGNITKSARISRLGNGTIYNYKEKYEWFRNGMAEAMSEFADKLEGDAFDLIKKQMTQEDGYKSNPALLIFLLKGAKPEKYQEHIKPDTTAMQLIDEIKNLNKKASKKKKKEKKSMSQVALDEANEILKDKGIEK